MDTNFHNLIVIIDTTFILMNHKKTDITIKLCLFFHHHDCKIFSLNDVDLILITKRSYIKKIKSIYYC